jgi:hypothetical protein
MAARTRDAVLMTAVRETVVLYAEVVLAIGLPDQRYLLGRSGLPRVAHG